MNLLLDTHVLLWWLQDSARLSPAARSAIADPGSAVFVSAASVWEIAIKASVGRLQWPARARVPLEEVAAACGFLDLPVTAAHAAATRNLARHHADPFDRLLVAQARLDGLTVATADPAFEPYDVPVLAASRDAR